MLSEEGHHVTVFINDKTVRSISIENLKEARVIRFNPSSTNSGSFLGHTTQLSFEFANIVKTFIEKEGNPDIIESQDYQGIAYFILQFKYCLFDWCKNIPIVITMHSPSFLYMEYNQLPIYKKPNFWVGEMERYCIQATDLLISPSQYLVTELKKRFTITNTKIHVLANPYKTTVASSTLKKGSILNNSLTFYGKLSPQKGTFKILEHFKILWEKGFDKPLTMVGGQEIFFPPLGKTMGIIVKNQYSKYIKKGLLKLEDKIAPTKVFNFLSNRQIIIIPSIVDNLPYTVLEMMSQGKVLIVSKQGGQSEVISNAQDGFIFDYDIPGSFESILNKVLGLTIDERVVICRNAILKIAENYSYKKIYGQKIKLIENLIQEHRPTPKTFPFIQTSTQKKPIAIDLNSEKEKLSVIIPYYNMGKYIDETINSVLKSTYKNFEILIVNDGSTDALSIEKINKYKSFDKIRVIDKMNSGLAETRNCGAEMAKGEFIAFLDADDTIEPTYYEKAIKILSNYNNVHFVGAWTQYFGGSKKIWPTFNPEAPLLLTHNTINSSALVLKKQSFLEFGKNDSNFKIGLEDYDSVLSMISNGANGIAIPEPLFNYRVRKKSMIKNVTKEVRSDYYNKIGEKHKALYAEFEKEINELIYFNGAPLNSDNSTLDFLPFSSIPILNKITKTLINKVKSNSKLKKTLLIMRVNFKKK